MGFYGILMGFNGIYDGYPLVNVNKQLWKFTLMGKSTISTGPFSIAKCNKLAEGKVPLKNPIVDPIVDGFDG